MPTLYIQNSEYTTDRYEIYFIDQMREPGWGGGYLCDTEDHSEFARKAVSLKSVLIDSNIHSVLPLGSTLYPPPPPPRHGFI